MLPVNSQTFDCGGPPQDVVNYSELKSDWKKYMCTSRNIDVGAKIPISDADLPVGVKYTEDEATCTQEDKSDQSIQFTISKYIFTHDSVRIAECGFRACELLRAGGDQGVIDQFIGMCGSYGGAPDGTQSSIRLLDPINQITVEPKEFGTKQIVELRIQGSSDAPLPYEFEGDPALDAGSHKKGTLPRGLAVQLNITVKIPHTERGFPQRLKFSVAVGRPADQRTLFGYVLVGRRLNFAELNCAPDSWKDDSCRRCIYSTGGIAGLSGNFMRSFDCVSMPPGVATRATLSGFFGVLPRPKGEGPDTKLTINLDTAGGSTQGQSFNGIPGSSFPYGIQVSGKIDGSDPAHNGFTRFWGACASYIGGDFCQATSPGFIVIETLDPNSPTVEKEPAKQFEKQ